MTFCCGDLTCEGDEDGLTCAVDCGEAPACGDGVCQEDENSCNCDTDCVSPPGLEGSCADGVDNDCDGLIDCHDPDCAGDPACPACDYGGLCEPGEDCRNCSKDCAGESRERYSGGFCCGNGTLEDAEGNGDVCHSNP